MSATGNFTLTMTSDLTSDSLAVSVLKSLTSLTLGGVSRVKLATTAISGATILAPTAKYTAGALVWLYNPATAASSGDDRVYVSFDETSAQIILKGGDWALVPWAAISSRASSQPNIEAYGQVADAVIEFGVFN